MTLGVEYSFLLEMLNKAQLNMSASLYEALYPPGDPNWKKKAMLRLWNSPVENLEQWWRLKSQEPWWQDIVDRYGPESDWD